jgi:hypothetical protein
VDFCPRAFVAGSPAAGVSQSTENKQKSPHPKNQTSLEKIRGKTLK